MERLNLIHAPSQTIGVVDGTLTFVTPRGLHLTSYEEGDTSTIDGVMYFDQTSNNLRYYADSKWITINLDDQLKDYADLRTSSHFATGSYKPVNNESRIFATTSTGNSSWSLFSDDDFYNLTVDKTFNHKVTFQGTSTLVTELQMNGAVISNVAAGIFLDADAVTKGYVDSELASFDDYVESKVSVLRNQISDIDTGYSTPFNPKDPSGTLHRSLQDLWQSKQITVGNTHPSYTAQKAAYDQAVAITKDLLNRGRI